jgi:hypothetical protein
MKNRILLGIVAAIIGLPSAASVETVKIVPDQVPTDCQDSFAALQHARGLRDKQPDFPSLKHIAAKREAAFLACYHGKSIPSGDLLDYNKDAPDVVVW